MTQTSKDCKQRITQALRTASVQQLEQFTGRDGFKVDELATRFQLGQVLGDQMILLVISGNDIRMTVKIHYKQSETQKLAKYPFKAANDDELQVQLTDYMKELSNQICGRVCRVFESQDVHLGMSIPLKLRGFYEVYSDYSDAIDPLLKFGDFWEVSNSDGGFFLSSYVEVSNLAALSHLQFDSSQDEQQDDSQDLEFL